MPAPQSRAQAPNPFPILPMVVSLIGFLVIVGSFGPWAKVGIFTVGGMDGDGLFTLLLGLLAGGLPLIRLARPNYRRRLMWASFSAFVLSFALGAYNWGNVEELADSAGSLATVEVGWGLTLVTIGSFVGAPLAARDAVFGGSRHVEPTGPEPPPPPIF